MNAELPIRVLIVEDHAVVRMGLRRLLEDLPDIDVMGDTECGDEAIRIVQEYAPDVVLLDLVLENSPVDGLDVLKAITATSPSTRVVVLSAYPDDGTVFPALRAGAIGYVLKRAMPEEVIEAVRDAARGRYHMDPLILKKIIERIPPATDQSGDEVAASLTKREREILPFLTQGLTNGEIAAKLMISRATVKTHVSNILDKLGVSDRGKIGMRLAQNKPKPPA
jgi:DNA-binding NarL/FixJ family response regulator